MGVPQKLDDANLNDFYEVTSDALLHLMNVAASDKLYPMIDHCKNKHPMCTQWAIVGM